MVAITVIGNDESGLTARALAQSLSAPEPVIRRCAIETLGFLQVASAVPQITRHLSDEAAIPEAWFDDTSTPARAGRRALEAIGTPAALEALRRRYPVLAEPPAARPA